MTTIDSLPRPGAQRVARRALVLAAVACRSFSDHDPNNPEAIDLWERLKFWVDAQQLGEEIEPSEHALVFAPLGSLTSQARISGTWRVEGLAILSWALGLQPFPPHDSKVDPYVVTDNVALLNEEAADIVKSAHLRPTNELQACRELLYAVHCRLRQVMRERMPHDIRHWIESEWIKALGASAVLHQSGDLAIGGKPVFELERDAIATCESTICERHRAIIWLVGEGGPVYSQVTVDT